jgi:phasin family protein
MAEESNPFSKLIQMLEQFRVPGVDMSSIIEARRKDIEALLDVNRSAYESMQAVARKQTEILTQAMQGLQDFAKAAATGGVGAPDVAKQTELARKAYQKALADMTDLAEMVRKSQVDAMAGITQRATQSLEDLKKLVQPK